MKSSIKQTLSGVALMLCNLDEQKAKTLTENVLSKIDDGSPKTGATLDPEILINHIADYFADKLDVLGNPNRDKYEFPRAPQFFGQIGSPVGYEYLTPNQLSRTLVRVSRLWPRLVYYSGNDKKPPYYYELNIPAILEHTGHFCPPLRK